MSWQPHCFQRQLRQFLNRQEESEQLEQQKLSGASLKAQIFDPERLEQIVMAKDVPSFCIQELDGVPRWTRMPERTMFSDMMQLSKQPKK
jgi:hypothetical protein